MHVKVDDKPLQPNNKTTVFRIWVALRSTRWCARVQWHAHMYGGAAWGGGRLACVCLWTRPLTISYKGFLSARRHRDLSDRAVRTRANAYCKIIPC